MQVVSGACLTCTFGVAPGTLNVLPMNRTQATTPAANIMDHVPMMNITSFGMCSSPANPVVISATAAKLGVFTPMPCVPATTSPWTPGSATVQVANMPALNQTSTCLCLWGGLIQVTNPGQTKTTIP
jgi:hypothetical protein